MPPGRPRKPRAPISRRRCAPFSTWPPAQALARPSSTSTLPTRATKVSECSTGCASKPWSGRTRKGQQGRRRWKVCRAEGAYYSHDTKNWEACVRGARTNTLLHPECAKTGLLCGSNPAGATAVVDSSQCALSVSPCMCDQRGGLRCARRSKSPPRPPVASGAAVLRRQSRARSSRPLRSARSGPCRHAGCRNHRRSGRWSGP